MVRSSGSLFIDVTQSGLRLWLLLHAGIFKNIGPLAARARMAVLQVLSEVIRPVEFLDIVALAEFVHTSQVLKPTLPVCLRKIGKFLAAITAGVVRWTRAGLCTG